MIDSQSLYLIIDTQVRQTIGISVILIGMLLLNQGSIH